MNIQFKLRNLLLTFTALLLIFYLIYHALNGERGILIYLKLRTKYNKLLHKLDEAKSERFKIEHKVNLLQDDSIDLDLLEEQVKKNLPYARDNEQIYYEHELAKDSKLK